MSELLQAAKAVIEYWDAEATNNLQNEVIDNLRAAVDRAEKQEAVGFEEWWVTPNGCLNKYECETAWTAGQQAERERIKTIIKRFSSECSEDGEWVRCCNELLEKIDEALLEGEDCRDN